jgi:hypothetical protein
MIPSTAAQQSVGPEREHNDSHEISFFRARSTGSLGVTGNRGGTEESGEMDVKKKETPQGRETASVQRRMRSTPAGAVPVDPTALGPYNSYGPPQFVQRGYYLDMMFQCQGCGIEQVWTAAQQKWWYEEAQGYVYSTATKCRACRGRDRERRAESRELHRAGVARKRRNTTECPPEN